jgi:excisionase family DNA binding protein
VSATIDALQKHLDLLTEDEAAALLRVEPQTLRLWRATGRYGLPFVKVGRCVRYRRCDLEKWIESRVIGEE